MAKSILIARLSRPPATCSGFSLDTILGVAKPQARFVLAFCDGSYGINLPLADVIGNKARIVDAYDGEPLPPRHGGPVRLQVLHLYFWKSAKWVRGMRIVEEDQPGSWESLGYHNYGDPWKEQRYQGA